MTELARVGFDSVLDFVLLFLSEFIGDRFA